MADDPKTATMSQLRRAAARVRKHEDERKALAKAIVEARLAGWAPKDIQKEVPYDRNHVGRIFKADKRIELRQPKKAVHRAADAA